MDRSHDRIDDLAGTEALPPEEGRRGRLPAAACVACAVLIVLGLGLCLGGGYYFYSRSTIEEPAAVTQVFQQVLPSELPPGFQGVRALDASWTGVDMKLAVIAPEAASERGRLVIGVGRFPEDTPPEQAREQLRNTLVPLHPMFGTMVPEERRAVVLNVGGRKVPAREVLGGTEGPGQVRWISTVLRLPQGDLLGLSFIGQRAGFDEQALQGFLDSVQLPEGAEPVDPPADADVGSAPHPVEETPVVGPPSRE